MDKKSPYIRMPRRLARLRARIVYICPTYIDYIEIPVGHAERERRGFARLDRKQSDIEPDRWDQMIGILEEAVRWGTVLELVVESKEEPCEPGEKVQRIHYLIDAITV